MRAIICDRAYLTAFGQRLDPGACRFGNVVLGDWLPLVIEWDYGAFAALGAAIISLAVAIAAIRDAPRRQRMPGY
jgi:hypothetical protein